MEKKTRGQIISELRKEKGMTQLELAKEMNVTDKAVSKWERDLSCPDINSLPKLAELLGITSDELLSLKSSTEPTEEKKTDEIISLILRAIPLAMGVAVIVTSILKELDMCSGFIMLGVGLMCLAINSFKNESD